MNWKRGAVRLLIVVLAVGGFAALLITGEEERWVIARETIVTWLVFLLTGIAGYGVMRSVQQICYLFRQVSNKEEERKEKRRINLHKEFREGTLISALICSGILFFVSFALYTRGKNPAYFISLIASFMVFLISFGLVWLVYGMILFVARGFAGEDEYDKDVLDNLTADMFSQMICPGKDALTAFIPKDKDPFEELGNILEEAAEFRVYEIGDSKKVQLPDIPDCYDENVFEIEKDGWNHEHCDKCSATIRAGDTLWVAEQGENQFLFCDNCYNNLNKK